jgi:hypothetical protein
MAATGRKSSLAALMRQGDKGTIKRTTSGKFQPQLFIKELNTQRALGSCDTAEEAAEKLAEANDKLKRKEAVFAAPVKKQAKHGSVRCPCPPSALHIGTRALSLTTLTTLHLVLQASMTAEERELMEEADAIKAAQRTAKEIFGIPQEETKKKVNKTQDKVTAPSNGVSGPSEQKRAPEGGMARWLARSAVQG